MNKDMRDVALQSLTPTVMVPLFGEFEMLASSGHRFLSAKDGLWIEARRPGIYSRQPIARQNIVAMPYGKVASCIELGCGQIPKDEIRRFVEYARTKMPNEVAMAMIWDDRKKALTSVVLEPIDSSPVHLRYKRPELETYQHVVADIHSHGSLHAFFSGSMKKDDDAEKNDKDDDAETDDKDDRADLKVAIVVGNLDTPQPTVMARMCTYGHYKALDITL